MAFKDHFSAGSDAYRRFRPTYPDALFARLAGLVRHHDLAWDSGCGSGQASAGLAGHFARVEATDASAQQIAQAPVLDRVTFRTAPAEASGLPPASVDLAVVAQAIHWFDFDAYYAEVRRVVRPGGVLAVVGYGLFNVDPAIDQLIREMHGVIVGPYWPPERRLVDDGYVAIPFPFPELAAPTDLAMTAEWDLDDVLGYVSTWSAVQAFRKERGSDPVAALAPALAPLWPGRQTVRWPIFLRLGQL